MSRIGYEVLTLLGHRFSRVYRDAAADASLPQFSEGFVS